MRNRVQGPQIQAPRCAGTQRAPKRARGMAVGRAGARRGCRRPGRGWDVLATRVGRIAHRFSCTRRDWSFGDGR
jgi:hypothetical protein